LNWLNSNVFCSLTNVVVKSKRETTLPSVAFVSLFGFTITKGPVGMPMADAYGKITGFVKEPCFQNKIWPFGIAIPAVIHPWSV
jgi:hypothetical protein